MEQPAPFLARTRGAGMMPISCNWGIRWIRVPFQRVCHILPSLRERRSRSGQHETGDERFAEPVARKTRVAILGAAMYLIEGEENGFTSIPLAIYWSIVTMTTVGYGDMGTLRPILCSGRRWPRS